MRYPLVVSSSVFCMCRSVIDVIYSENWPEIDTAFGTNLPTIMGLLLSPAFWSTLHPATVPLRSSSVNNQLCPFSVASFGQGQPHVRQAAWALVGSLVGVFKGLFLFPRCCVRGKYTLCVFLSSCTFFLAVSKYDMHLVFGYICSLQASSAYMHSPHHV